MDMLIGDANGKLHLFNNTGSNPPNFVLAEAEYKGLDVGYFAFPQLVDVKILKVSFKKLELLLF